MLQTNHKFYLAKGYFDDDYDVECWLLTEQELDNYLVAGIIELVEWRTDGSLYYFTEQFLKDAAGATRH